MGRTRTEKAAKDLASGIIEMVHLMYQNVTARRFLEDLVDRLTKELNERKK